MSFSSWLSAGIAADLKSANSWTIRGCSTAEAERSLVRSGYSPADAQRLARALDQRHAESSRDHMRRIFTNVPAIYGFSKLAPLGPAAPLRSTP